MPNWRSENELGLPKFPLWKGTVGSGSTQSCLTWYGGDQRIWDGEGTFFQENKLS